MESVDDIRMGIDIGGSLAKMAIVYDKNITKFDFDYIELENDKRLYLGMWLTSEIDKVIEFIQKYELLKPGDKLQATGGGAFKFSQYFKDKLDIEIIKNDEMKSLVTGMLTIFEMLDKWCFTYSEKEGKIYQDTELSIYPKLLVSIGSGVSMIKVNSRDESERVSGTMIGGGTLIGLSNILLKVNSFDKIQDLCKDSDHTTVDTLVKDLYGHKYEGLEPDTLATSFGKIASLTKDELSNN